MRWGVIGTGRHAADRIVPALAASGQDYADGVGSSAARFGGRAYPDLDALRSDDTVEAVFVTTPNDQHRAQVERAAAARKHVPVELRRVRAVHGNPKIFGGSYGWSSAGRFHRAQSQVHRFLNTIGGNVRHVDTYSLGAGRVIMPHVTGTSTICTRSTPPGMCRHSTRNCSSASAACR